MLGVKPCRGRRKVSNIGGECCVKSHCGMNSIHDCGIPFSSSPLVAERNMLLLRQELECVRESMLEQQMLVVQKEKEVAALHQLLGTVQGACQEKILVREVELLEF